MSGRALTLLVWFVLGGTVAAMLLGSALSHGRLATLAELVDRASARRTSRVLFLLGWMWLGWHLFAR